MWTNLSPPRPAAQPRAARSSQPAPNRSELKRELALCDENDRRRRELQSRLLGVEAAIEGAVAQHQAAASTIHERLAVADSTERRELHDKLDAANEALDSECKKLRARLGPLQEQSVTAAYAAPNRGRIEEMLIATAREGLQQQYWRAGQNVEWAEAREHAAAKSLEAARQLAAHSNIGAEERAEHATAAALWQFEHEACVAEFTAAVHELETLRQELLNE